MREDDDILVAIRNKRTGELMFLEGVITEYEDTRDMARAFNNPLGELLRGERNHIHLGLEGRRVDAWPGDRQGAAEVFDVQFSEVKD